MLRLEIEFSVPLASNTSATVKMRIQIVFRKRLGQKLYYNNKYSSLRIPFTIVENIIKVMKLTIGMYRSNFFICYLCYQKLVLELVFLEWKQDLYQLVLYDRRVHVEVFPDLRVEYLTHHAINFQLLSQPKLIQLVH